MLYKFGHVREVDIVSLDIPEDAYNDLFQCVQVLDNEYGEDRNIENDDGGYVVFLNAAEDLDQLREFFAVDAHIPEWVNLTRSGYTTTLYMLNNDFGVVLVMPETLARTISNIQDELNSSPAL